MNELKCSFPPIRKVSGLELFSTQYIKNQYLQARRSLYKATFDFIRGKKILTLIEYTST